MLLLPPVLLSAAPGAAGEAFDTGGSAAAMADDDALQPAGAFGDSAAAPEMAAHAADAGANPQVVLDLSTLV